MTFCYNPDPDLDAQPQTPSQTVEGLSVVIPTFRRTSLCETLLASLHESQSRCEAATEIWVIDDSPDPDAQQIESACQRYGAHYIWHHGSVAQKRNVGVKHGQYPVVLFVDSDCRAESDLLQAHVQGYRSNKNTVAIVGKTEFEGPQNWLWHVVELTPYLDAFGIAHHQLQVVWGPTNNLSCRKSVFEQVGGFDEHSPQPIGGEDADLGYRFYRQGYLMDTCPEAVVYHSTQTWNTLGQLLQRLIRWCRGDIYLKQRYWTELYYDCPSRFGMVLLLLLVAVVVSVDTSRLLWLLWPFIFVGVSIGSGVAQQMWGSPRRLLKPVQVLAAEVIVLFYDACFLLHCGRSLCLKPLFASLLLRPEDALVIWECRTFQFWLRTAEVGISAWITMLFLSLR